MLEEISITKITLGAITIIVKMSTYLPMHQAMLRQFAKKIIPFSTLCAEMSRFLMGIAMSGKCRGCVKYYGTLGTCQRFVSVPIVYIQLTSCCLMDTTHWAEEVAGIFVFDEMVLNTPFSDCGLLSGGVGKGTCRSGVSTLSSTCDAMLLFSGLTLDGSFRWNLLFGAKRGTG